jgi:hypothetical protein
MNNILEKSDEFTFKNISMKKYLLTIIGNFKSENECKEIALTLTPIVDSPQLKFQHKNGILIFHFATEVSKEEIFDYVTGILFGITDSYILSEYNDNMTLSMPKDIKEHLLDLENSSDDIDMRIDMSKAKNNFDISSDDDDDDFIALLLGEKNHLFKKPSLDFILDKINEKGYNCLTEFEKDTLENYSKK